MGLGIGNQFLEGHLAFLKALAFTRVKAGIAFLEHFGQLALLKDIGSTQQGTGQCVHTTDVSDKDVLGVGAVAAQLGIKVGTTVLEAAATHNLQHSIGEFITVDGELVSIPTVLVVTAVSIDAAQHVVIHSNCQLV